MWRLLRQVNFVLGGSKYAFASPSQPRSVTRRDQKHKVQRNSKAPVVRAQIVEQISARFWGDIGRDARNACETAEQE
jgi:hypothetical protein